MATELASDAHQAALEARMLMAGLRPGAAPAESLAEALRAWVRTFAERSGAHVELIDSAGDVDGRLSQHDTHELLRIVGEAMTNAVTHGHATRLEVALRRGPDGALIVSVTDDGRGFSDPIDLEQLKAAGHFGLAGMHERARLIGATLLVESRESGAIVSVRLSPPAEQDGAGDPPRRLGRRWSVRRRSGALEPRTAAKEAS
jgi:signal transduction histidine kinase